MINLAENKFWDLGYNNLSLAPMGLEYPITKIIYKYVPKTKNAKLFEVGCYPGRFIFHFGSLGYELNGVDQTSHLPRMISWLKKYDMNIGRIEQDDFFSIRLEPKYDLVFSSGFIEHFDNFEEVIDMHCKLVKKGGRLFITTPNFRGPVQKFLHGWLDKQNLSFHNLEAMNIDRWKQILIKNGFEVSRSGYIGSFDFWIAPDKSRSLIKRIISKLISISAKFIWLPNNRIYSPEMFIIASKI